ncbi:hypothetical protein HYS92_02095 [Candidatus Daviesbacteria bacterium]|nr:hypothetical protein [Candidatus Daviesbacteria bacterium]
MKKLLLFLIFTLLAFLQAQTAYASHGPNTEDWYCSGSKIYHSANYKASLADRFWAWWGGFHDEVRNCGAEEGNNGNGMECRELKSPPGNSAEDVICVDSDYQPPSSAPQPGRDSGNAPSNLEPKAGTIEVKEGKSIRFIWIGPANTQNYDLYIDDVKYTDIPHISLSALGYRPFEGGMKDIHESGFQDGKTYTWWVDAFDEQGNKTTSRGFEITINKQHEPNYVFSCEGRVLVTRDASRLNSPKVGSIDCGLENKVCKEGVPGSSYTAECVDEETGEVTPPLIPSGVTTPRTVTPPAAGPGPQAPVARVPGGAAGTADQGGTQVGTCQGAPIILKPDGSKVVDAPCGDNPPVCGGIGERPEGYRWKADCSKPCTQNDGVGGCPQNTTSGYVRPETSNWCYGFKSGNRCLMLEYEGEPGGGAGGTGTTVTGWNGPEVCNSGGKFGGCTIGGNQPCSDWGSQNYQGWSQTVYEKCKQICSSSSERASADAVCAAKTGAPSTTRTTTKFRFAEDPASLQGAEWRTYTTGGVTVSHIFANSTPDDQRRFIYAEFEIITKDAQGNITKTETHQATHSIVFAKPVAASEEASGGTYSCTAKQTACSCSSTDPNSPNYAGKCLNPCNGGWCKAGICDSCSATISSAGGGGGTNVITDPASCNSISVRDGKAGSGSSARMSFSGTGNSTPAEAKIWIASNSEIGKSAGSVTSWTPVKTISIPVSGQEYTFDIPSGFAPGSHAVLMSLHGPSGLMLDGNVGGQVNSNCTTTIDIN